jgi:hypothetical protein
MSQKTSAVILSIAKDLARIAVNVVEVATPAVLGTTREILHPADAGIQDDVLENYWPAKVHRFFDLVPEAPG